MPEMKYQMYDHLKDDTMEIKQFLWTKERQKHQKNFGRKQNLDRGEKHNTTNDFCKEAFEDE